VSKRTATPYAVSDADLFTGYTAARRIDADLRRRIAAVCADDAPPSELRPAIAALRTEPPAWCEPAAWGRRCDAMLRWAESFGGLEVVNAIDKAGGSHEAAITLHQRTLPDLRERWMPRVGLVPPTRTPRANG
jgi:hypothetical protein